LRNQAFNPPVADKYGKYRVDNILKGVKMKNWLGFLMLFPLSMLSSCENQSAVVTTGQTRTINIKLKISAVPERNLKLYVAEGKAGSYKETSPTTYKPEDIKYSGRKYIGTTPIEKTFTFRLDGSEKGFWKPPQYALYFIQKDSSESSIRISPWGYRHKDLSTGEGKDVFYDSEQFPLDYFQTHPNVRNVSLQKDLRLKALE
jgi:hypothetical protein